jgi:hypothetical protein
MTIRTRLISHIVLTGILFASAAGLAQAGLSDLDKSIDQTVGDHVKVHEILTSLQQAVTRHDAATVASLVHYPIKINPGHHAFTVKDPKAFIKNYDRIITPDISAVILKQKYETLFANSQGAMIGDGEVWISGSCLDKSCKSSDIKISTIQDTANLNLKP